MALRDFGGAGLRRAARGGPLPLVVALYLVAALVATLPAIGSFGSAFIANGADGEGETAAGDHLQAVYRFWLVGHQLERGEAPWTDPYSFQPLVEPQTVLSGWPFGLPFWPLEAAFGPVVAWNLFLLATIVAAGLLTYGWLRALALPPAAAAVGGLAFAIAPYRLAPIGVPPLGWGAFGAAALVSVPLSGQLHLALGVIPLVAIYSALRFAPVAAAWTAAGLAAAVGVGLAIHLTIVRNSAESGGRSLQEVGEFSADWIDFVSRRQLDGLEQFVYVGWVLPILAGAGAVLLWRGGTRALAALAAAAVSRAVVAAGRRAAVTAAALLALVAADLLVLPLGASAVDGDNRAYAALREEPPGRVLELPLFEPGIHYGSAYDAYQLQAPRERPGGYSTLVPQPAFDFFFQHNRLSCGIWLPGDEETLDELGVEYVAFHLGLYRQGGVPGAWFGWQVLADHGFAPIARGGEVTLFGRGDGAAREAPVAEPSRAEPLLCEGWRDRTMRERQGLLWLYGSGPVRLEVSAIADTPAALWVDGRLVDETQVSGLAALEGELEGEGWHALVLEIPRLLDAEPPQGLTLAAVTLASALR